MRIIAISGKSGCGNSTISATVAQRLGYSLINYTLRSMAEERGISFSQMLELAQNTYDYDRELDKKQVSLAHKGDCVIGSRLAIWLLPDAFLRVFLSADLQTRAKRIKNRGNPEETIEFTKQRDNQDHERFLAIYGIDNDNLDCADLIINTERWDVDAIVNMIVAACNSAHERQP